MVVGLAQRRRVQGASLGLELGKQIVAPGLVFIVDAPDEDRHQICERAQLGFKFDRHPSSSSKHLTPIMYFIEFKDKHVVCTRKLGYPCVVELQQFNPYLANPCGNLRCAENEEPHLQILAARRYCQLPTEIPPAFRHFRGNEKFLMTYARYRRMDRALKKH